MTLEQRVADGITRFCGSMTFVHLHAGWFGGWVYWNMFGPHSFRFDPYPFGLLTMIVSLEAIFLSTFILISQNRGTEKDRLTAESTHKVSIQVKQTLAFMESHLEAQHEMMMRLLNEIVSSEQHQTELVEIVRHEMEEQHA